MASMNTRLNIEKLDGNIIQKHGGVHRVQIEKHVWFEVELQGAQGNHEAVIFQVSNDDAAVAQRRLEGKQLEENTKHGLLGKEAGKVTPWYKDQDRQMLMVEDNVGNQFRTNAMQNVRNQVALNASQNPGVQNVGNQNGA
uniref:Uncharacterized protein n=1 Tax=Tanacetum cinerariifolium TaxID=118510 RepID=A0A699HH64_TANCI|nr:hypothetical protein [Tanacetum cinerariifolium]